MVLRSVKRSSYSLERTSITSFSCDLACLSLSALLKRLLPITTPFIEGGAFRDAFLTSPALSPKIALSNFSSGVGSLSPLGVILPISISPSDTSAPILIRPFSLKSLVASALTFGISFVSSSIPRLVSRTSNENSSI